eukprot:CAMPEP_0181343754 /NCGR_PEP_ID=MMETSP1101-20121128/31767_1 /TAXON_ID=46948 /ORGANISM="Rhodomonas abbreviata, Strain Caron Lab Isolate" /LENGTH=46 /DNA_ID= /DNA_START= /DNA_END= /DNA_ORIENTATION=
MWERTWCKPEGYYATLNNEDEHLATAEHGPIVHYWAHIGLRFYRAG